MKKLVLMSLLMFVACGNDDSRVCNWLLESDCNRNTADSYHEPLARKSSATIKINSNSKKSTSVKHDTNKNIFNIAKRKQKKFRRYVKNKRYIAIINFDLPYTSKRFWLYDTKENKTVFRSKVSHASRTGGRYANRFSNTPNSYLSSKGSFVTLNTYDGKYGYSLRLKGLERGINNNALKRGIVFHPDNGMTHSAGCFMLPDSLAEEMFDRIKNGILVYVHKS